jgi:glycosyltransferase involved in cell wall biosynthesis
MNPPVLGYYARLTPGLGLDVVVDAFLRLRQTPRFAGLRLRAGGGSTSHDRPFIDSLRAKLARSGAAEAAEIEADYSPGDRTEFFRSLTLMSSPSRIEDGYGLHLMEAIAAGVPVVQPSRGAFPEIVSMTGGGTIYNGDNGAALADAVGALLLDPDRLRALARAGRETIQARFTVAHFARDTMEWYIGARTRTPSGNREAKP